MGYPVPYRPIRNDYYYNSLLSISYENLSGGIDPVFGSALSKQFDFLKTCITLILDAARGSGFDATASTLLDNHIIN